MKLKANIEDGSHDVEIDVRGDNIKATIDGRKYDVTVTRPEPDTLLVKDGDRIFDSHISKTGESEYHIRAGSGEFDVSISDPKRLRGMGGAGDLTDGIAELRTAMHGKIVRLLVEQGDEVEKGQGVIVVEAMKMQNELRSPKAGQVKEIRGEVDQTVAAGDLLMIIE